MDSGCCDFVRTCRQFCLGIIDSSAIMDNPTRLFDIPISKKIYFPQINICADNRMFTYDEYRHITKCSPQKRLKEFYYNYPSYAEQIKTLMTLWSEKADRLFDSFMPLYIKTFWYNTFLLPIFLGIPEGLSDERLAMTMLSSAIFALHDDENIHPIEIFGEAHINFSTLNRLSDCMLELIGDSTSLDYILFHRKSIVGFCIAHPNFSSSQFKIGSSGSSTYENEEFDSETYDPLRRYVFMASDDYHVCKNIQSICGPVNVYDIICTCMERYHPMSAYHWLTDIDYCIPVSAFDATTIALDILMMDASHHTPFGPAVSIHRKESLDDALIHHNGDFIRVLVILGQLRRYLEDEGMGIHITDAGLPASLLAFFSSINDGMPFDFCAESLSSTLSSEEGADVAA